MTPYKSKYLFSFQALNHINVGIYDKTFTHLLFRVIH
jgi:hypothetical protein